jgi:SAM-dependent methyltransferase
LSAPADDNWDAGDAYEHYMGRWSRPLARRFVAWLAPPPGRRWLDVGCGTGAVTAAILEGADPASVLACDPSRPFVEHARKAIRDPRVTFTIGGAEQLPDGPRLDFVVSGLALNFMPDPARAVAAMVARLDDGGTLAASVWDYAGGIGFLRRFWDAAVTLDAGANELDEGRRFPLCRPEPLAALFEGAGLGGVTVGAVEIQTRFADFADYWTPFLKGTGPAPAYVASLPPDRREALRDLLASSLPVGADGGIALDARAWAVRGVRTSPRRRISG